MTNSVNDNGKTPEQKRLTKVVRDIKDLDKKGKYGAAHKLYKKNFP